MNYLRMRLVLRLAAGLGLRWWFDNRPEMKGVQAFDRIVNPIGPADGPDGIDSIIAAADAWSLERNVEIAMDALRCPPDDADVTTLSGGERRRVALCRLLLSRPDLLLLDEPTASLDPTAKREVETLIEQFAAHGTTLLMSSHNLGQVKRLASRVLYLEHGRLLADVATDAFFNGPLPAEAALFLKGELPWA